MKRTCHILKKNPTILSTKDFVVRKGFREYKGIKGFDNLMYLIRADIKAIHNDYLPHRQNTPGEERADEAALILAPYEHWNRWVTSNFCTLTKMQIVAIDYYRKNLGHKQLAADYGLSYNSVMIYFRQALILLKHLSTREKYKQWLNLKDYTDIHHFLDAPVTGLQSVMSSRLRFLLSTTGKGTLREILEKRTTKELLEIRGFGKKSINELKEVLKNKNCLSLLKN